MELRSDGPYSQAYLTGSLHLFGLILGIRKLYIPEEVKYIGGGIGVSWSSWNAQGFRLLGFGYRDIVLSFFEVKLLTTNDWLKRSGELQIRRFNQKLSEASKKQGTHRRSGRLGSTGDGRLAGLGLGHGEDGKKIGEISEIRTFESDEVNGLCTYMVRDGQCRVDRLRP
jgi:hypothetical protein